MILADDNTLWIGMTKCTNGERANNSLPYGCLTMYNTSTNTVTLLEPYIGDATGIAAVTGLHKIYTAEGGQVYIYSTVDGSAIDNQFVTVTGTAYRRGLHGRDYRRQQHGLLGSASWQQPV